jgi:hypothetical protein
MIDLNAAYRSNVSSELGADFGSRERVATVTSKLFDGNLFAQIG